MKRTAKTLSILVMAFAMAMCFFFAGLSFIKAEETNATETVGLSVLPGASVYLGGGVEDTGIKFDMQISEEGYADLCEQADAGNAGSGSVHLGIQIGRVDVNGEFTTLASYTVKTTDTLAEGENAGYKQYSFSLMYNLERIFAKKYPSVGYIASETAENYDEAIYTAQQNYINAMYFDELCVRPWYKTITESNEETLVYGDVSEARSMMHVAVGEIHNANTVDGYDKMTEDQLAQFKAKYLNGDIEEKVGVVEIYADGTTSVALTGADSYTIDNSGKVVAREDGIIDASALTELTLNQEFTLYGFDYDTRTVVSYSAKFVGLGDITSTPIAKTAVFDADGKIYLNDIGLDGKTIQGVFYDNALISNNNGIDVSVIKEEIGENVALIVKADNEFYSVNATYATKVFVNTPDSRAEMARLFSAGECRGTGTAAYTPRDVYGYYALAGNLDFSVYDENDTFTKAEVFDNGDGLARNNTFYGTFDGRGYTLNNIPYFYNANGGMFGVAGSGATIKNVAFNGTMKVASATATSASKTVATYGMIFYSVEKADSVVTVENVYVNRSATSNAAYYGIFFYSAVETGVEYIENFNETGKTVESTSYATGVLNFNNVVTNGNLSKTPSMFASQGYYYEVEKVLVEGSDSEYTYEYVLDDEGDEITHGNITKYPSAVRETDAITNTYFVGGAFARAQTSVPTATIINEGEEDQFTSEFKKVSSMSAITETKSFTDTDYWTLVDGVLAWKTCSTVVTFAGENVSTATESVTDSSNTFAITLTENGIDKTSDLSFEITGDAVAEVAEGSNVITVIGNVKGTATVTATYNEVVVGTYTLNVDTRVFTDIEREIAVSAFNNKIYLDEIEQLDGIEITDIIYNESSVYLGEGLVDTSILVPSATAYTGVELYTTDGAYRLNVKSYTDVFENTLESKHRMTETFGTSNTTAICDRRTGYYALAEDLTFYDGNEPAEGWGYIAFGGCIQGDYCLYEEGIGGVQVFDATFDGRGYALNNLIMQHSVINFDYNGTQRIYNYGMFGAEIGKNAKLMNFAINEVVFLTTSGISTSANSAYMSSLFADGFEATSTASGNVSEISNVYVRSNLYARNGSSSGVRGFALFTSSAATTFGFHTISNTIVNFNMTNIASTSQDENGNSLYASLYFRSGNTKTISTTNAPAFNDTYFVINGNAWGTHAAVNGAEADFDGLYTYTSVANMPTEEGTYSNFVGENGNNCWVIGLNGVPAWKSTYANNISIYKDDALADVSGVLNKAGDTYTVKAHDADSQEIETGVGLRLKTETDVVSISGNTFTVLANKQGAAEIIVTYNGATIDTISIEVDTAYVLSVLKNGSEVEGANIATENVADEFTVKVFDNAGEEITEGIVLSTDSEMVTIENGVIKAVAGYEGSAEITVTCAGDALPSIIIYVDTQYHFEATLGGNVVEGTEITYTNTEDKLYINLVGGGTQADVSEYTIEIEGEGVTLSGNELVIGADLDCVANVTATWGDLTVTYVITINTVSAKEVTEEVLLSKFDGKLYLNGTEISQDLKFENITSVVYEGEELFADGKVTTSGFTEVGDANKYSLTIMAGDAKYEFVDNVIVCDDVFENTPYSRTRMATKFGADTSSGAKTYTVYGTGEEVAKVIGDLEGYFALAENLTFDEYNGNTAEDRTISRNEMFGGRINYGVKTFNATFDGRGYTLNNVILDRQGSSYAGQMFGSNSGPNAVLKNFAINGVKFYYSSAVVEDTHSTNMAFFFYYPKSVVAESHTSEISNVYINLKATRTSGFPALYYNLNSVDETTATIGFKTWSNVIINYVAGTDDTVNDSKARILSMATGALPTTKEEHVSISNTYFVINGGIAPSTTSIPESYGEGLKYYKNMAAMEAAGNDYSSFSSKYWTVTEGGVPVWNTLPVAAE